MAEVYKLIKENRKLERLVSQYKQVLGANPFVDDSTFKGGLRVVKTIQDRDKIDCCHRKLGMIVSVIDMDKWYKLISSDCSNNWVEVKFGSDIPEGTYVPMIGLDESISERITGPLIVSNYDYNQYPTNTDYFYTFIGGGKFISQKGIFNNDKPSYKFTLGADSGYTYSGVIDDGYNKLLHTFNMNSNGMYISTSKAASLTDSTSRSGSILLDPSGNFSMSSNYTDTNTFLQKYTALNFNPVNNTARFSFYKSNTSMVRETILSYDGISTTTLPNANGDSTYTRQLMQKEDGTVGYQDKPLPPKIDNFTSRSKIQNVQYTQDNDNYYITGEVFHISERDNHYNLSPGNLEFFLNGVPQTNNDIYIERVVIPQYGSMNNITKSDGTLGRAYFTFIPFKITIPKYANDSSLYYDGFGYIGFIIRYLGTGGQAPIEAPIHYLRAVFTSPAPVDATTLKARNLPNVFGDNTFNRLLVQNEGSGEIGFIYKPEFLKGTVSIYPGVGTVNLDFNIARTFVNTVFSHSDINDTSNPITINVQTKAPTYEQSESYWVLTNYQIVVTIKYGTCDTCYFNFIRKDGVISNVQSGTRFLLPAGSTLLVTPYGVHQIK